MAGLSRKQWGGYLLEEVVAWMLGTSGYRLLTDASSDPEELTWQGNGLRVRGRGATHQADVLGELVYVPPFSLPLRMFVEAKCWATERVGLGEVRNAHGVIHDVNQNWASARRTSWTPRQRYHYLYALFSTSGFTADAQEFAMAHQIVLVDLSTPEFSRLRDGILEAARALTETDPVPSTAAVRAELRKDLGTDLLARGNAESMLVGELSRDAAMALARLTQFVLGWHTTIILGFPAAPFILALTTQDLDGVARALRRHPVMNVNLAPVDRSSEASEWEISSEGEAEFALRFSLPDAVNQWLAASGRESSRRSTLRSAFLSDITLVLSEDERTELFKLVYQSTDWVQ